MYCINCDRPTDPTRTNDHGDAICERCVDSELHVQRAFAKAQPDVATWASLTCDGCRLTWLAMRGAGTSRCPGCCGEVAVPALDAAQG